MKFKDFILIFPREIQEYLHKCSLTPQNPKWHPEGANEVVPHNVLAHTKIVYEKALKTNDKELMLSAIFHDLGKADTTKLNNKGTLSAYGHEFISAGLVKKYADWIAQECNVNPDAVYNIVKEHMRVKYMDEMRESKKQEVISNIYFDKIIQFSKCDDMSDLK